MRIPRADVLYREAWLACLFNALPGLSVRAAQTLLIKETGKQMRPARVLAIRKNVRAALALTRPQPLEYTPGHD